MLLPFLNSVWNITVVLAPWLVLGSLMAGVLHVLVPAELIRQRFSGIGGVVRAVILGVPLPLCSCGVIPAGIGLKKDGASDGSAVGFMISTPQTGVDSILVSASFLGWPFALFKVAAAVVTGVAGGALVEVVSQHASTSHSPADGMQSKAEKEGFWNHVLDVLSSIWRWLVVGIFISAAIEHVTPEDGFAALQEISTGLSMVVALVVGLPMYVCATASVPIAASLVTAGLSPGAALVFLMAGPATNVATIGAVYRTLGARNLAIYLTVIVLGSIGAGLLFDGLLMGVSTTNLDHHEHQTWWGQASAIVLTGLLGYFALRDARQAYARWTISGATQRPTTILNVDGMSCGGCVRKLETKLGLLQGVEGVEVTLDPGSARVIGDVGSQVLLKAVSEAGFEGSLRQ